MVGTKIRDRALNDLSIYGRSVNRAARIYATRPELYPLPLGLKHSSENWTPVLPPGSRRFGLQRVQDIHGGPTAPVGLPCGSALLA